MISVILGVLAGAAFIGLIYLVRLWPPRRSRTDR